MTHSKNIAIVRYENSIEAFRKVLSLEMQVEREQNHSQPGAVQPFCTVTFRPTGIFYMKNGLEYYFVEVTCKDNIQYRIQAFGDEAVELYREVQRSTRTDMKNG